MADIHQPLTVAELCAGYGGLGMALRLAGWPVELAWVAENDPDAAAVMAAHHPGVPNVGDVTTAQFTAQQPVDVIAAGFPCQDVSAAGLRAGLMPGSRSGLWTHIARAIRLLRPSLVLLENVRGLLSARAHSNVEPCPWCVGDPADQRALRALGAVLGDLAGLGFDAEWISLPASAVGAPHHRWRVFLLAWPTTDADRDTVRPQPVGIGARPYPAVAGDDREGARELTLLPTPRATDGTKGGPNQRGSSGDLMLPSAVRLLPTPTAVHHARNATANRRDPKPTTTTTSWTLADVAHADRWGNYAAAIARWEATIGRQAPDPTEPGRNGQPRLSARFVEWLMGLPAGWVTDHVGRNAALRILGNGVVPQQGALATGTLCRQLERAA